MPPVIAHIDLDAFYASVELQRRPELRGRPVIVAGSGPRAVVTTASYEARRFGVRSAMPTAHARRLCPEAVLVPPDVEAYRAASQRVMEIVRAHVETVEQLGLDEAYLDLTGHLAPRAAMRRLVADIREHCSLQCSVGIGPNRLVAKVASDAEKPRGFVVLSREEACDRFAAASPGLVPGIGPKTVARLERMGITTLAGLAIAPEPRLVAEFGPKHGPDLRRRARFEGPATVTPLRVAVSESREQTFDTDIEDPAHQEALLRGLAAELAGRVRRAGCRGRTVAIKVRLDDFSTATRARTLAVATDDAGVIADVAAQLLREYAPPRPVRLLGVRLAGLDRTAADTTQLTLDLEVGSPPCPR